MSGMIRDDDQGNVKRLIRAYEPIPGTALDRDITIKQVSGTPAIARSVSPPFNMHDHGIPPAPISRRRDSS